MITIPGRIPIRIYPIFWIFALLISAINSETPFQFFSWFFVIFASIIIHEMGHALTAIGFGQKAHIDLLGFGGLTHRHGKPLSPWKDFFIVLNGPMAGIVLCLASLYMLTLPINYSQNGLFMLNLFFYANLFWTGVNLIPVYPLDGGHLLRIPLESLFGLNGVRVAFFISLVLSVAVGIFFFAYNFLLGGVLFMMLTYENYKAWRLSLDTTPADKSEPLQQLFRDAQNDFHHDRTAEAVGKLEKVRQSASGGMIYMGATILLADINLKQGKAQGAYDLLDPLRSKLPADGLRLLQDAAYRSRQWGEAIAVGTLAYQAEPLYETAVLNAMGHAQLGEAQAAVGWLKCAVRDGLPQLNDILRHHDFDSIRGDAQFRTLSD